MVKFMYIFKNTILKLRMSMLVALVMGISACGGGGGGSTSGTTNYTLSSGILTDDPVEGVAYLTSTGVSGVTGAGGTYNFNVGDTVEFKLGNLVLGNVTATGIVTPIELAAGNSNRLTNLLVLLQSLDVDGNPANGISIPPLAAAAITTAIDLTVAPASFNTTALQAAMDAGGITAPIVTEAEAGASFLAQGMTLLSSNIWVSLPAANTGGRTILLRFAANGDYLHGEAGANVGSGTAGVEQGSASLPSFDTHGYKFAASAVVDTNDQWGLSHPLPCDRLRSVGDQLIATEGTTADGGVTCTENTNATISKAGNDPAGIVGVWALGSATVINTQHLAFFSNGKFLMVDPIGDTAIPSCGGPGVESGSYTYNGNTLTVSNFDYDTNGCAGLKDGTVSPSLTFIIGTDGATATISDGVDPAVTLFRVSK